MVSTQQYNKNNKTLLPKIKIEQNRMIATTLYKRYRELTEIKQEQLNQLSEFIFGMFDLDNVCIYFSGKQPHRKSNKKLKMKTLGKHISYGKNGDIATIQIYKFTAVKKKIVSPKTAIDILIHEIMHNLDIRLLKLNSIHCKGFYARIKQLKDMLK